MNRIGFLALAFLVVIVPGDASARPPRKGSGGITAKVTSVGPIIECDIWNKYDTRAHGLPRSAKTAADCFLTLFTAINTSFPIDQGHVCVPAGEALISTDHQWVCAAGGWLVHNTFVAMNKVGFPICRYEATMNQAGIVLQVLDNTCGF